MSYWVSPRIPIFCVTVQRLTNLEQNTVIWQNQMDNFDNAIKQRLEIKNPYTPHFQDVAFTYWRLSMNSDREFFEDYARLG